MLVQKVVSEADAPEEAQVLINAATLARLFGKKQLSVAEMKILDARSKQLIRKICLDTCLQSNPAKW
jgi:hypothetical protein